jgi:hypothetical protein
MKCGPGATHVRRGKENSMNRSRRQFLTACGAAAASLSLSSATALPAANAAAKHRPLKRRKGYVMVAELKQETFEPLLDSEFALFDEEKNRHTLKLIEVEGNTKDPRFEQFSIVFRGPLQPVLPQKIYPFEHPEIGSFSLFIVPIGQEAEGTLYQAVFNRFKDKSMMPPGFRREE